MPQPRILYYITDRKAFAGDEHTRRRSLLEKIAEAGTAGIDYIQLREKDLPAHDLESLAREAIQIIRNQNKPGTENRKPKTALLINSRTDIALATEANGVHLPANDLSPKEVRQIWRCGAGASAREFSPRDPMISISCHSPEQVAEAASNAATVALFAPIFEKKDAPGTTATGLEALREACRAKIPVLALGGVTLQNAASCFSAGAAGIAAIRLFQENDISAIVRTLRIR
jgi:thiamine-phosphate pyrophosphorylase